MRSEYWSRNLRNLRKPSSTTGRPRATGAAARLGGNMITVSYHPWQVAHFHARGLYFCRVDGRVVLSDELDGQCLEDDVLLSSMRFLMDTDAFRRADDLPVRIAFLESLHEFPAVFGDTSYDVLVFDNLVLDLYLAGRRYCPARGLWLRAAPSGWALTGPPGRVWGALV